VHATENIKHNFDFLVDNITTISDMVGNMIAISFHILLYNTEGAVSEGGTGTIVLQRRGVDNRPVVARRQRAFTDDESPAKR